MNYGTSMVEVSSRELTYPFPKALLQDDFPFPQVGYVGSLEGISNLGGDFPARGLVVVTTERWKTI